MIFDAQNLFSDDQDLSQDAGTYYSTNSLDLTTTPRVIGPGEAVTIWWQMTEAFDSAGAATLAIALIESSDAGPPSADIAVVDVFDTGAMAKTVPILGYKRAWHVPLAAIGQQYLSMRYTIASATSTAGTITAGIVWDGQTALNGWPAESGF
jgi:hypothetical protein